MSNPATSEATITPATGSTATAMAVAPKTPKIPESLKNLLENLFYRQPPEDPKERRRQRAIRYHLCQERARLCLHRGVLIASIIAFIICVVIAALFLSGIIRPYFRANSPVGGIAVLSAIACIVFAGVALQNLHEIRATAWQYADFVLAMLNEKGEFVPRDDDELNHDYAAYIRALGQIYVSNRELYTWFKTGTPPKRKLPDFFGNDAVNTVAIPEPK